MNLVSVINKHVFFWTTLACLGACAQNPKENGGQPITQTPNSRKMKIEIWSDVMCPFCYIGKRKFETALAGFNHKDNVEIVWKSFQLNPDLKTDPNKNTLQYLAETKGWTMDYTKNTIAYVSNMAKEVGLDYNFDKAVVANSFDAHRLIQLAKKSGKGDAAEEELFKAYFTNGKNTADHTVLMEIGSAIGLDAGEVKTMLAGKAFSEEVKKDLEEAGQLGISGVPFFVFDRKYAVSGAQQPEAFMDTLTKAWENYEKNKPMTITNAQGAACEPGKDCK